MISLYNISKTYKSKKTRNTKALDDVSLTFDKKGMTFILGKSGSGKSTLLNILGGLDKYDNGDLEILGKSTKKFKTSDFDSYRNTYVGFIFQEFNILEDYDVYENIILALQLQQKKINEKEIDELLEKLELTELKKRKVNELSGGQKQRVAIARALIKDPKIILADEPTGNLDSKTGKQVMDLLKSISKEKLVVVVSHDEEYASMYGDRIIEIKDGKIIKDTKEVKNKKEENTYKVVKSKLPFKDSFKLGIGSLRHKKVKLAFTILLTIISLGFFSCADTLSNYDFNRTHARHLAENNEQFIEIKKQHVIKTKYDTETIAVSLDETAKKEIQNKMKKDSYSVYHYFTNDSWNEFGTDIKTLLHIVNKNSNGFYNSNAADLVATSDISKILKEKITGKTPTKKNEIIISNYIANQIINDGIEVSEIVYKDEFKETHEFKPKTYEEILNTKYTYLLGKEKVKIVGIINYDLSKSNSFVEENIYNKIYVLPEFTDELKTKKLPKLKTYYKTKLDVGEKKEDSEGMYSIASTNALDHEIEYFNGSSWVKTSTLKENEVILNINEIDSNRSYSEDLNNYINKNISNYNYDYDKLKRKFLANYFKEKNIIGKKVKLSINMEGNYSGGELFKEYDNLVVVGIYESDDSRFNEDYSYGDNNYVSKKLLDEYMQNKVEEASLLFPMTEDKDFKKASKNFPPNSELAIKTTYSKILFNEKTTLEVFKKLALYAGLIFVSFDILLIMNFMYNSISYRKKEVGILRALGSKSTDVMKIFLWEAIVLSLISGTFASILLVIVSNALNPFVKTHMRLLSTPFLVGIRQFLVIYLLVFLVTFISSILPLLRMSKMKPIDAILNK